MADLRTAAQRAGTVRPDIDVADLKALLVGCRGPRARRRHPGGTGEARDLMLAVIRDGLRARQ